MEGAEPETFSSSSPVSTHKHRHPLRSTTPATKSSLYVLLPISHILLSSELLPLFSKGAVETRKRDQVTSGLQGHIQEHEAIATLIRTNLSCKILSPQSTYSNPSSSEINRYRRYWYYPVLTRRDPSTPRILAGPIRRQLFEHPNMLSVYTKANINRCLTLKLVLIALILEFSGQRA